MLVDATDILPGEKVQVVNLSTGSRLETYIIEGVSESSIVSP